MDDFRRTPVNRAPGASLQPQPQPQPQPLSPLRPAALQDPQSPPMRPSAPVTPVSPSYRPVSPSVPVEPELLPNLQIQDEAPQAGTKKPKRKRRVGVIIAAIVGTLVVLALLAVVAAWFWYQSQLAPVDTARTDKVVVTIDTGSSPTVIASVLEEKGLIRSSTAFMWYTRFEGVQNNLQAGAYRLAPSESTQEIVTHLVSGKVDMFDVTLYPGATLRDTTSTPEEKKLDVTSALKRAGFTEEQIEQGLAADYSEYNDTLFQGRPADADLEGYVYGDTYRLSSDASVEDVLRESFDHLWEAIEENNLVAKFKAQGLNLYQGITFASIVQRESGGDDKEGIAAVFYNRIKGGQQLGSDVTYQYITDKLGVQRDINYDSPYNTRRYTGLPPGPIAAPGLSSLIATGTPATSEYLYFLSGDDNITYFATTLEQHEANIRDHCQLKCQII